MRQRRSPVLPADDAGKRGASATSKRGMTGYIDQQGPAPAGHRLIPAVRAWLAWHAEMGMADLDMEDWPAAPVAEPHAKAAASPAMVVPAAVPAPLPALPTRQRPGALRGDREAVGNARRIAAACDTLDELRQALEDFDGCALKDTATRLCFADGAADARIMLIGEAPGSEEDRQGLPFVGPSGQMLDRMLATIGLDRGNVWITNVIYWRPPGNRAPTAGEIATCQPFLERQIELLRPSVMLFVGGIAARALLETTEGVTRLRGRRFAYRGPGLAQPIPALVTFHPAYLLRSPLNKRFAWRDLLTLDAWLAELGHPHRR